MTGPYHEGPVCEGPAQTTRGTALHIYPQPAAQVLKLPPRGLCSRVSGCFVNPAEAGPREEGGLLAAASSLSAASEAGRAARAHHRRSAGRSQAKASGFLPPAQSCEGGKPESCTASTQSQRASSTRPRLPRFGEAVGGRGERGGPKPAWSQGRSGETPSQGPPCSTSTPGRPAAARWP